MKMLWTGICGMLAMSAVIAATNPAVQPLSAASRIRLTPLMTTPAARRGDPVSVPIALEGVAAREVQVRSRVGSQWRVTTNALQGAGVSGRLLLEPNQVHYITAPRPKVAAESLSTNASDLGGMAAYVGEDGRVATAQIFALAARKALVWDAASQRYTNRLFLGVHTNGPADLVRKLLPQTILLVGGDVDVTPPEAVVISAPGIAGHREVGVSSRRFLAAAQVMAISDYDTNTVSLPMERSGVDGVLAAVDRRVPLIYPLALLGGALGGWARLVIFRGTRAGRMIGGGALLGLVIVATLAAGLRLGNLEPALVQKGAGAFGVSIFAAFVGAERVGGWLRRLWGAEEKAKPAA